MPNHSQEWFPATPLRVRHWIGILIAFWTAAVALVLVCEIYDEYHRAEDLLRREREGVARTEEAIQLMQKVNIRDRYLGYGGMWIVGLGGIWLFSRQLKRQIRRRTEAEQKLEDAYKDLEQRVAERTAELAAANHLLESEIAERRKAEQWLLESEERFRGYFEQGLVGMAMLSDKKDWIEVNQRLCRMLGYTESELVLIPWDTLTHPDDLSAEQSRFQQMLDGVVSGFVFDKRMIRKNKETFPVNLSAKCLRKKDGQIDCIVILIQDASHHGLT